MLSRYVIADLVRNPRRTLSTMVGVTLGVGLFCGVLFFVDGLSASMTQRAVAPLAIDMQRVITEPVGASLTLTQRIDRLGPAAAGDRVTVTLHIENTRDVPANEVTIRSLTTAGLTYVVGSARLDDDTISPVGDNPLAHGPGRTGLNIGTLQPGGRHTITYSLEATRAIAIDDATIDTTYSSRESITPSPANEAPPVGLDTLATMIAAVDGVTSASPLMLADLGFDTLSTATSTAGGPAKIMGFDGRYAANDSTIDITGGELDAQGAVISAEVADTLGIGVDDPLTVLLPDGSSETFPVTGIADLSRARSLFSSRRGGDLETFVYTRHSVIVSPATFDAVVEPAFERAASARGDRLKAPPIREIDITIDRSVLDADPATAVAQTERIAAAVGDVAAHQDYMLDNISNTLEVATADAAVAKRLFVFLGVPGGLLAAMLAAYSGTVLAEAQRREQATLRIRGAGRRHLLRMLALRTALLTGAGAVVGLACGYGVAAAILGKESLDRASVAGLIRSAGIGTLGGFLATGLALYLTGRRSIDREIDEDRARLNNRPPLWRRAGLDVVGVVIVIAGTVVAVRRHAFDGAAGSVYFGRSVELDLSLLVLPLSVWVAGSLLAARLVATALARSGPTSTPRLGTPLRSLYRLGVCRRPWAIGNGAIVVSLIVALATSLTGFTASYDAAKIRDARFANGADIRITPGPTSRPSDTIAATDGIASATPVVYGLSNVILRSARTSDPANLAAIDPAGFVAVAPVDDHDFADGGGAAAAIGALAADPTAVLVSTDMAAFLRADVGDTLDVLLARATDQQVEIQLHIVGLFERLPGFPEGADALMSIHTHTDTVPTKAPDFFLASTTDASDAGVERAVDTLRAGPGTADRLQIDSRLDTLARDQSSLAALNIAGLVDLDSVFSSSMAVVTIAIFVFGLLLQRRREYITLRALGLESRTIRTLITAEAGTVALTGTLAGLVVGAAMGSYFVAVLRPLFVVAPHYTLPVQRLLLPVSLVALATVVSAIGASRLIGTLAPTELLRDE